MHLRRIKIAPVAAIVAGLLLFGSTLTIIAHADASLAPSIVTAATSTYDGQSVTVTGTVKNITTRTTPRGTRTRYDLCDSVCLSVVDFTSPTVADGDHRTITGTFHATLPRHNETNVIFVGEREGAGAGTAWNHSPSPR